MQKKSSWQKEIGKFKPRFTEFVLNPKKTALVIIDMQYQAAHPDYGVALTLRERGFSQAEIDSYYRRIAKVVVPNQMKLLDFFRRNGLRVIYVATGAMLPDKADRSPTRSKKIPHVSDFEYRVLEEIKPQSDELVINKTTYSAFTSTGIDQTLRNMEITDLVIAGVGTNVCVETTTRDASDRGYRCVLVEDACTTYLQRMHDNTLATFALWFGKAKSTDEVIRELRGGIMKSKS